MGCECTKFGTSNRIGPKDSPPNDSTANPGNNRTGDDTLKDDVSSISDTSVVDATINFLASAADDHVEIVDADPEAFNASFIKQRQDAIDNLSYRSTINSWKPTSLKQLNDMIRNLSKGKSLIDQHWIIFYWISCNIEYDTVSYFSKNYKDQTAEGVFRNRKGVCAGYANIYKYLCDQLQLPCEVVGGYSKGYGFDSRAGAPTKTDHAWNAVEIDHHWYLIESTWGTGHLNEQKAFERKLDAYYFLPRPNEMIYHHLPEKEKWQLLQTPIKMTQYMQMPELNPLYFELNLELVSPLHQAHVSLVRDKSYALILIRTPSDVNLTASLKLNGHKVEGGHRIIFNHRKQLYRCYFAPANIGKHKITIFAKRIDSNTKSYGDALAFPLNIDKLPQNLISYPETWKPFYDLHLKLISPANTHLIKLSDGKNHTCIIIRAPKDVELSGSLCNSKEKKIEGGKQVYYDRRESVWKCKFAPDRDGLFDACIYGKKKFDTGSYTSLVLFKIEATNIVLPPLSYPYMSQLFYDLNLKVEAPRNCSTVTWPEKASFVEVLMQTPDDVQLSCAIQYNNINIENGSLSQFDNEKNLWQLLFAPERIGQHELVVFAKHTDEEKSGYVLKFYLNVTQLQQPMKFPTVYGGFHNNKCRIFEPLNGILKKGATVPIHCIIPAANDVNLQVDSKWITAEGYQDPILKRSIAIGSKEVTIYAKYGEKSNYDGLIKYIVQ